ncbi:MAG: prepilin-type N-terminal cleavage/methylation domain-containing protein [Rhodoferax sp.]|uniref:prepilin-type N-terminal cleavage/methylation domain-containing protein n=1 Tax=Rhodoferax sp. TaxID=50421 RepID=UPI002617ED25|nr:prepilin-type N-terminal cleavage/methylation domain-containing protein [Rhodoferax sp.]MDD5333129.1 prepilin-type N-terminal cleavage/methylation domain-containing protein [Rhodoferax sp.]
MQQATLGRHLQRGFTLVEMAIVLTVIGLIIGAIAIGKDVQRNAEYQKVANKFLYQWKQSYDQYYQRSGVVVGDCQQAPTYMVNGGETTIGGAGACARPGGQAVAGIPESFGNTGLKVCEGQGYAPATTGAGDAGLAAQALRTLMTHIGIRPPPGRGEGHEDRYLYQDSNGNAAEVQVCFQWNPPGTASGAGNVMVVRGLTPDLARFLDQVIDGKPDSREGRFRIQGRAAHAGAATANGPGTAWEANNTIASVIQTADAATGAAAPGAATATGRQFDEDRVVLLTAHWIMEQ